MPRPGSTFKDCMAQPILEFWLLIHGVQALEKAITVLRDKARDLLKRVYDCSNPTATPRSPKPGEEPGGRGTGVPPLLDMALGDNG